ncbi:hypothetical protein ACF090_13190 [Streptomyces sp. NPDC014892]|uniref:hypothetical protein n=1 Tax=Streptomyces sp. NPDC014892 TaxID=3364930 RepID=UPI0036FDD207
MRTRTTTLLAACLLAVGAVGCSESDDAKDCATALTERTGGSSDTPTVAEAKERVEALDTTLASMVRSGYEDAAKEAFDTLGKKTKEGEDRPEACEALSEDDYTALLTGTAIDGLGWTDKDGQFDKLKMVESL